MKGIIYYTHGMWEPIGSAVRAQLLKCNLPIVSCSLQPLDFGKNIVLDREPSRITMTEQILTALENSTADTIFFCEHDVLYHPSHFDFELPSRDKFYYNVNVWRWNYPRNHAVTYEFSRSLSGLCVDRELAIEYYRKRLEFIKKNGYVTRFGYEPGTNRFTDNYEFVDWKSKFPIIDIRHYGTVTPRKCRKTSFVNPPDWSTWKETTLDKIDGWDYKYLKTVCPTKT